MNAIGRTINLSLELKRLHFLASSPLSCECREKNSWAIWQSLPAPGHNPCLATASGHRTEQAKVLLGKAKLSPGLPGSHTPPWPPWSGHPAHCPQLAETMRRPMRRHAPHHPPPHAFSSENHFLTISLFYFHDNYPHNIVERIVSSPTCSHGNISFSLNYCYCGTEGGSGLESIQIFPPH